MVSWFVLTVGAGIAAAAYTILRLVLVYVKDECSETLAKRQPVNHI